MKTSTRDKLELARKELESIRSQQWNEEMECLSEYREKLETIKKKYREKILPALTKFDELCSEYAPHCDHPSIKDYEESECPICNHIVFPVDNLTSE